MNYELLIDIIDQLSVVNPFKARKLSTLMEKHFAEDDQKKKKELEKKINRAVYSIFGKCINKDDLSDFYNTGSCINEECFNVEQSEEDRWFIFSDGARRYVKSEEGLELANYIPREYKKGFYIQERSASYENNDKDILLELRFLKRHQIKLDTISRLMDHKEELITNNYRLRNSSVPRDFVEELIDFLGIHRIQSTKKNTK